MWKGKIRFSACAFLTTYHECQLKYHKQFKIDRHCKKVQNMSIFCVKTQFNFLSFSLTIFFSFLSSLFSRADLLQENEICIGSLSYLVRDFREIM